MNAISPQDLAVELRKLASNHTLLFDVPRLAIENQLVEMRDSNMFVLRNNGLCIKERDGSLSGLIRMGPEMAVSIALTALADHLDKK